MARNAKTAKLSPSRTVASDRRPLASAIEIAQFLGVSRGQIYGLMDSGQLPFYRVGSLRRVRWDDVDKLLAESTVAAG